MRGKAHPPKGMLRSAEIRASLINPSTQIRALATTSHHRTFQVASHTIALLVSQCGLKIRYRT